VRNGETIVIEDRGVAIAELAPVNGRSTDTDDDKIARLTRAGILRPAKADPRAVWDEVRARPLVRTKRSVVEALLEERRQGR
jgi:antitoxin (DNA-binding transcriptional repressor) of toxin-antitoxin stability system